MKQILAALLIGFVALGTVAIAAPVSGDEERTVGNIAFTPLQDDSGWVKYTKESGDLVTSWHVQGLVVGSVYDLMFVYGENTVIIAEDVVAEANVFDDETTSTYGSIELINQFTVDLGDGLYEGVFKAVGEDDSEIVSAASSFTLF